MPSSILILAELFAEWTTIVGGLNPLVATASSIQYDVVSSASLIVTKIMIETDFSDTTSLK